MRAWVEHGEFARLWFYALKKNACVLDNWDWQYYLTIKLYMCMWQLIGQIWQLMWTSLTIVPESLTVNNFSYVPVWQLNFASSNFVHFEIPYLGIEINACFFQIMQVVCFFFLSGWCLIIVQFPYSLVAWVYQEDKHSYNVQPLWKNVFRCYSWIPVENNIIIIMSQVCRKSDSDLSYHTAYHYLHHNCSLDHTYNIHSYAADYSSIVWAYG